MLRCDEVAARASDFLDQNMSWGNRVSFRLHVMMCANCRRFVHQLNLLTQAAQLRELPEPSQDQIDRWVQSVDQRKLPPSQDGGDQ